MQRRELGDEREPDARALVGARARVDHAMEALEQPLLLGGRDADARVGHDELGDVPVRVRPTTVMPPSKVNLSALETRLRTTFAHISLSISTGAGSGGQSIVSVRSARATAESNIAASSAV